MLELESEADFLHRFSTPLAIAILVVDLAIDEGADKPIGSQLAEAQRALAQLKTLLEQRRQNLSQAAQ